ncbi:hypothetical protein NFI96_031199 [Prochilodus magdalenae]|nr:hypothetical protein NFI96_031199 [Prochilodus magdalenae]
MDKKIVVIALAFLLAISQGQHLKCYQCSSFKPQTKCLTSTTVNCTLPKPACGLFFNLGTLTMYQDCMTVDQCLSLHQASGGGKCCNSDLCN